MSLKSDKEATECRHTKRDKKWNSEKDRDIDKYTYRQIERERERERERE